MQLESKSKQSSSRKAELALERPRTEMCILIRRSRDVDDGVWFGLEETLDRTLSATGSRTVCRKAMQNIGGQFNSNDVVNEGVSSESQCVSCSSVENELSSAGVSVSNVSDVQFCVKECARRCLRSSTAEGIAHLQISLVFFRV